MPKLIHQKSSVVIDSSCFIHLERLGLLTQLVIRYEPVYIPRYVFEEVGRKGKRKHSLKLLLRQYPFLKICRIEDPYSVQLLSDRNLNPQAPIDRGEAEAIIQAQERGISEVLIDDRKGRGFAEKHSLQVKGTLGILMEFKRIGFVPEIKPLIDQLRQSRTFPISKKLIQAALREMNED